MKTTANIAALLAALALTLSACAGTPASSGKGLSLEEGIAQIARAIGDALPSGCRVAVVGFASPVARFSDYVLDEMQGALQNSRHLTLTERVRLDAVRKEQGFQFSGEVDEASAVMLGKFLGAQIVVIGNITPLGGNTARLRFTAIDVETAVRKASPAATVRVDPVWGL
ncbi:MAG: CsgG/HfaB family protein [Spirochaetaceae bacterium]|jgi:curli biogenesis system outer membrane secretion channel CsgG|nr:CsgG/HfaB family protein [Spirochaetaceae bacterium]